MTNRPLTTRTSLVGVSLASVMLALPCGSETRAEMAEDTLLSPTQSAMTHLFPLNPAVHRKITTQAGLLVIRNGRTTSLDQTSTGGDVIESKVSDDHVGFAAFTDLGAGAAIGLSHQTLYRKIETTFSSDRAGLPPREELLKQQQSAVQLIVELTESLRAGLSIRYLYNDVVLLGSPRLGADETTRYNATMVGYGSGFTYNFAMAGVSYTYFPPLRGKTEVYGEEKIIVEPGEIVADVYFQPNTQWTIGLLGKRWIQELDDRAAGTTSADDETNISLYGLSPDQYLFQQRLLMIGADYAATKQLSISASLGQEEADFDFINLLRYDRLDVRQNADDKGHGIKSNLLRAMVKFVNQGIELNAGLGLFTRAQDLPASMNAAVYDASGKEMFATISLKL